MKKSAPMKKASAKNCKSRPHRAAAIEKDSVAYLPIYDVQGTIRYLVDPSSMQIAEENDCDAFGRGLNPRIPYSYAGKRFDAATGLIYFGQRYYDPNLGRWLTQDPAGSVDSSNLYQYVFNNPLVYRDLDGQFAFVIPFLTEVPFFVTVPFFRKYLNFKFLNPIFCGFF